jgi:hypothetical protein
MTPRNLFNIILKVLGLFFIRDFLALVPQVLSVFIYFTKTDTISEAIWTFASTLAMLFVYGFVSYYLIFKTETIIDKLRLDSGFDQDIIPLSIHRSTILSISIIVIGGYIVAEEIPEFCRQMFAYYQEKRMTYGQANPKIQYSILSAVKIIIGFLLMAEQRKIVNFIEHKRKK